MTCRFQPIRVEGGASAAEHWQVNGPGRPRKCRVVNARLLRPAEVTSRARELAQRPRLEASTMPEVRSTPFNEALDEALAAVQEEQRRYPALVAIDQTLDEAAALVQATRRLNTAASRDVRWEMLIRCEQLLAQASDHILSCGNRTPEARPLLGTRLYFLRMVDDHWCALAKAHVRHYCRLARARRRHLHIG